MQDEVTQAADLLTKAIGDISAALTMAGKADKITEWTAPYVAAVNAMDEQAERDTLARMEPVAWQRRRKFALTSDPAGKVYQWEQCSAREATGHFEREAGCEYRALYTLPPAPEAV